jgi:ADP-L-glycero-D-manno-heptose 6-epimerase
MIIVTGAAGFIGSYMIGKLNAENFNDIIAVDDFSRDDKNINLHNKKLKEKVERTELEEWIKGKEEHIEFIIHLGARTNTAEFDYDLLKTLNTDYSKMLWDVCTNHQIPLIYASSAATYGLGEYGYDDNEEQIENLKPLNPYGESKNEFDKWILRQNEKPFFWVGLKFFNVYGPNEYHKDRMASVIFHAYNQIKESGKMRLFKSHNPEFKDGEQMRDFVYVKDVADIIFWLMHHRSNSGIYNLGSGKARTFNDLVTSVFNALNKPIEIDYIDTPIDIRDKYQYFTEANMEKLFTLGYPKSMHELEDGINDYVKNYLSTKRYF